MFKRLKCGDSVLEKEQIKNNLANIASNYSIMSKSNKKTYPIPRVKENEKYIYLKELIRFWYCVPRWIKFCEK